MPTKVILFCIAFTLLYVVNVDRPNQAVALAPTQTPAAGTPDIANYEALLKAGLQDNSLVQLVEVTDNRKTGGKRVITITFETVATTAKDRVSEWIALITPIVQTIQVHKLDIDELDLAGVTSTGDPVGLFYTTAQDLIDFGEKRITRAQFLDRAKYDAVASVSVSPTSAPTSAPSSGAVGSSQTKKLGPIYDSLYESTYSVQVTIEDVKYSPGDSFDNPGANKVFALIQLKVKNLGPGAMHSISGFDFQLKDANGALHSTDYIFSQECNFDLVDLSAGGNVSGCVAFKVPTSGRLEFIYAPYQYDTLEAGRYLSFIIRK